MNQPLPQAQEVEASVLSAILTAPGCIHNAIQILNDDCFYNKSYQNIWKAIMQTHKNNDAIDLINISEILKANKQLEDLGGVLGLMELTSQYFTSDVTGGCKILKEKYIRRNTITQQYELIKKAFDETNNITNEIAKSQNALNEVTSNNDAKVHTAHDVTLDIARDISDNLGKYQEVTGVPSGFEDYDKRLGGFSDEGDLYIIAARPSMGKTTFAINIAINAQKKFGYSGAFFSLEMSVKQIGRVILAKESGVNARNLKQNKVTTMQIEYIFDTLADEPESKLIINDESKQLSYIVAQIHKLYRTHNIKFAIVDYLQLMTCETKGTRALEVEHMSRTLKELAGVLGIPIIALCQLSRAVETRGGAKRPQLSDLRDSGAIEQDASIVTFLYRPEYYGISEAEDGTSLVGLTELITPKNRHGEIGNDFLHFNKQTANFESYNTETREVTSVENYDMKLVSLQDMNESQIDNFTKKMEDAEPQTFWNN